MLAIVPTSLFAKNFRLEQDNALIGEPDNSLWREHATLELEEGTYELFRERNWTGDFLLERNGNIVGNQLGSIYPAALFSRRVNIDLPADWPASTRAFLYWLTYLMWRRQNGAASA